MEISFLKSGQMGVSWKFHASGVEIADLGPLLWIYSRILKKLLETSAKCVIFTAAFMSPIIFYPNFEKKVAPQDPVPVDPYGNRCHPSAPPVSNNTMAAVSRSTDVPLKGFIVKGAVCAVMVAAVRKRIQFESYHRDL